MQKEIDGLLKLIGIQRNSPSLDLRNALRICFNNKKYEACVAIYGLLGLYEESVTMALKIDVEMAKEYAEMVENDEDLRKRLWIEIAEYMCIRAVIIDRYSSK